MRTNRKHFSNAALALALSITGTVTACDSGGDASGGTRKVDTSPHLKALSCMGNDDYRTAAKITGAFGDIEYCYGNTDGSIEVSFDATPNAPVTIGDVKAMSSEGGVADVKIELDPYILRAALAQVLGGSLAPITLHVKHEPPGAAVIEGDIQIELKDVEKRVRGLLAAIPTGTPLPLAKLGANPPARVPGSLVYVPVDKYDEPTAIGKPAALGALDLVAIARDGAVRDAPQECGPYDHFGMLPHKLIPIDVDVFDVATGKLITTKHLDGDWEECDMFMSGRPGEKPPVYSRPTDLAVSQALLELTNAR